MPRRRVGPFVLTVLFAIFPPSRAEAADRPLRDALVVDPGASCLDRDALLDDVRTWLGSDQVDAGVTIEVRGSPDQPRNVSFRMLRDGQVVASRAFEPGP